MLGVVLHPGDAEIKCRPSTKEVRSVSRVVSARQLRETLPPKPGLAAGKGEKNDMHCQVHCQEPGFIQIV